MNAESVACVIPRLVGPPGSFGSLVKPPSNCRMNLRHLSKFAAAIMYSSPSWQAVGQLTRDASIGGGSGKASTHWYTVRFSCRRRNGPALREAEQGSIER